MGSKGPTLIISVVLAFWTPLYVIGKLGRQLEVGKVIGSLEGNWGERRDEIRFI